MTDDDKTLVERLRGWDGCWPSQSGDLHRMVGRAANRIEALEAERDTALAQVAAAFEAAAQVVVEAGVAGDHPDDPLACMIRALTPTNARAAYAAALRKARAEGMREAAKMAHGKTVQEHYVEWPWWGPGNRSHESELAVFSKHLNDAILARADQIEKGEA